MSTSSVYSSNKLKDILKDKTQHFVIRSYMTAAFEYERRKEEMHLYWYNRNSSFDLELGKYHNMSFKKMNKKELNLFNSIINQYVKTVDRKDGCVWEHKEIGFNKDLVKTYQLSLL